MIWNSCFVFFLSSSTHRHTLPRFNPQTPTRGEFPPTNTKTFFLPRSPFLLLFLLVTKSNIFFKKIFFWRPPLNSDPFLSIGSAGRPRQSPSGERILLCGHLCRGYPSRSRDHSGLFYVLLSCHSNRWWRQVGHSLHVDLPLMFVYVCLFSICCCCCLSINRHSHFI